MKRIVSLAAVLILLCGLAPLTANAQDVNIAAAFTDPNFRAAVYQHVGKTAPAPIYETDVAGVTKLSLYGKNIQSLAGLEYFVGLQELYCAGNRLTSLPALPATLEWLICYDNQLTSLPALPPGLRQLQCHMNRLTSLPPLPSGLKDLFCGENQLTALPELPPGLQRLACNHNRLTSLPALPATLIGWLSLNDNQLTALPALPPGIYSLCVQNNRLTSLPALPAGLTGLDCSYNRLTKIDCTGTSAGRGFFDCRYNSMADESDVIGYAYGGFSFAPQATKAWLNKLLAQAKGTQVWGYTLSSWNALKKAIANAQPVADDANATWEQIAAQVEALHNALNKLTRVLGMAGGIFFSILYYGTMPIWIPAFFLFLLIAYGW